MMYLARADSLPHGPRDRLHGFHAHVEQRSLCCNRRFDRNGHRHFRWKTDEMKSEARGGFAERPEPSEKTREGNA